MLLPHSDIRFRSSAALWSERVNPGWSMGKRKFTADQAREALLATGLEMLDLVSPGTTHVSLAEAINRSGVPRPSAYRVFGAGDDDPQTEFQLQLIERVIADMPTVVDELSSSAIDEIMAKVNNVESPLDEARLTQSLVDLCRASADHAVRGLSTNSRYGVFLSAMAMVRTSNCERIEQVLHDMKAARARAHAAQIREWLSSFGLRLRDGWTEDSLYRSLNDATMGAVLSAKGSTGDEVDAAVTWLASTYVAITALATEPDPRRITAAQPLEMLATSPGQLLAQT